MLTILFCFAGSCFASDPGFRVLNFPLDLGLQVLNLRSLVSLLSLRALASVSSRDLLLAPWTPGAQIISVLCFACLCVA